MTLMTTVEDKVVRLGRQSDYPEENIPGSSCVATPETVFLQPDPEKETTDGGRLLEM